MGSLLPIDVLLLLQPAQFIPKQVFLGNLFLGDLGTPTLCKLLLDLLDLVPQVAQHLSTLSVEIDTHFLNCLNHDSVTRKITK